MIPLTTCQRLAGRRVLVLGLGASGRAAARLLCERGAQVTAVDEAQSESLRQAAAELKQLGLAVQLGGELPDDSFDLAVVSPGVPVTSRWRQELERRQVPVLGELELGYQHARCPTIAITGTNGKTTTTELVARMLDQTHRRTVAAGNIGLPLCAVVDQSPDLDWLTLEVSSFQLETAWYFRPTVAVLLNVTPDHLDRYEDLADYLGAKARLFRQQQPCDWAILQLEVWRQMQALGYAVAARRLTFSTREAAADLSVEGRRIISRLPGQAGTLLDLEATRLRGPHNAENLMAALGVALALRLPLAEAAAALQSYAPAPHRCELVAEIDGVQFINDSKATNVDAVHQALLTVRSGRDGGPNVWLIAGGKDKGFGYQELGPVLAQRVKRAFLLGETREKIRAAWDRFTPCTVVDSLLEAVTEAAQCAVGGDVVLLSPACSSFDLFQNYQQRGELFRQAVALWARQRTSMAPAARSSDK